MLVAHYRSILGYQVGPYAELRERLGDAPGEGRRDLAESADDIAQVSLAAAPFVSAWLTDALSSRPTRQILDIGCGTGVYTAAALAASPDATVTGIDLVEPVVDAARRHLDQAGFGRRFELVTGDARTWLAEREGVDEPFDAVLLLNDVYYVPPEERPALFRQVAGSLTPDGELLLVTLTRDGSLAAAHLHVMLVFQRGAASLPSTDELHRDLASAGLSVTDTERLVPTEPMLGIRAHREG